MLKGKEFGAAIARAIQLKLDSGAAKTKAEIARHFGMKPPSLADWVKKGSVAKDKLPELWRYFSDVAGPDHWGMTKSEWPAGLTDGRDIDHDHLKSDAGLLLSSNSKADDGEAQSSRIGGGHMLSAKVVPLVLRDHITIPQYDAGGAMGHGLVLPEQPGVIERWTVNAEWLDKNARGYTAARNLCIVTGFGPSMRPMFNPGDPLLVDRGVTSVPADGIYFFRIGTEGFIKQLQKIPTANGVIYRAKSANPDYDPFDITRDMDFEVLGKVIRVWCGTDF